MGIRKLGSVSGKHSRKKRNSVAYYPPLPAKSLKKKPRERKKDEKKTEMKGEKINEKEKSK